MKRRRRSRRVRRRQLTARQRRTFKRLGADYYPDDPQYKRRGNPKTVTAKVGRFLYRVKSNGTIRQCGYHAPRF